MTEGSIPGTMDFEIYLLMSMRRNANIKRHKLRSLGIDQSEAESRSRRVKGFLGFGPDRFLNLASILNIPVSKSNTSLLHPLKLWPDFNFYVENDGGFWGMAKFERASSATRPQMDLPEKLAPWSVAVDDFEATFSTFRCTDGFPPWEEFVFQGFDGVEYGADFSYRLLQKIEVITHLP
ncbi:hypothetical protein ACFWPH_11615 [Nocardia sp. NPDC058499]|uniref:hypothetical protein n=1 Tax=Nocardia sp. NPDC058499 TaxID=3346530 RepID=UPI003663D708